MLPYDSVPSDAKVESTCSQEFVVVYNQSVNRAEQVQRAIAADKDPTQEIDKLQLKCDDLFMWYPVSYGCVAESNKNIVFVELKPLAEVCDHPDQISESSQLPDRIKVYRAK